MTNLVTNRECMSLKGTKNLSEVLQQEAHWQSINFLQTFWKLPQTFSPEN